MSDSPFRRPPVRSNRHASTLLSAAAGETSGRGGRSSAGRTTRRGTSSSFCQVPQRFAGPSAECRPLALRRGCLILPLHGDLPPAEQDRAVSLVPQRKVILSTNVAESSITVEGVTAVVDSGLARVASESPWTGLPTLNVTRISKASATQRAGRAARTAPGRVIRLYSLDDFHRRRDQDAPEVTRRELSELCLTLRAMGISHPNQLAWLDPPPGDAVARAEELLQRLGATGDRARRMARYPLHPRLARLVVEAVDRGVGEEGCRVAALLSAGARSDSCDLLQSTRLGLGSIHSEALGADSPDRSSSSARSA